MSAPLCTTPTRAIRAAELIFAGPESLKARSSLSNPKVVPVLSTHTERRGG